MIMRLACGAGICILLLPPTTWATSISCGPSNTGIVCLDEASGTPLWEYFPDELGDFHLKTDGSELFAIRGAYWKYFRDPSPENLSPLEVIRVDPNTGRVVASSSPLPALETLEFASEVYEPLFTADGDRVVGNRYGRAITVMKGDSAEVRSILSLDQPCGQLRVFGNLIIYGPRRDSTSTPADLTVAAVDAETLTPVWTLEEGEVGLGTRLIDGRLYIATPERFRALDAATGRLIWQQRLERLWWDTSVVKHGDSVFVTCSYFESECQWPLFLYCLDDRTGDIRWQYDLGSASGRGLVFADGKVYARISPSRLMRSWRLGSRSGGLNRSDKWTSITLRQLAGGFAVKTPEEIELNLRAWHALGDGSAIGLLRAAEEFLADGALRNLPGELIDSFPSLRQPPALIEFLKDQFERHPELRTEIGRIVDDSNPIPYWHGREKCGSASMPCPRFALLTEELALIEAWQALKSRTDAVPIKSFTVEAVNELIFRKRTADFATLVSAHGATNDSDKRMMLRMAMYTQHPIAASDWALQHLEEISDMEIAQWVQRVPVQWFLAHKDLYLGWLTHEDDRVRSFSMGRITRMDDLSPALAICAEYLDAMIDREPVRQEWFDKAALKLIGEYGTAEHVPLLRRYANCAPNSHDDSMPGTDRGRCARAYDVRRAAAVALESFGVTVEIAPRQPQPPKYTKEEGERRAFFKKEAELERDMLRAWNSDRSAEAKTLAGELVTLLQAEPVEFFTRDRTLSEAYEVLEVWEEAIKHARAWVGDPFDGGGWRLLELYEQAGRFDDIEALVDRTRDSQDRIDGAFALMTGGRLDKAQAVFTKELEEHPNAADVCCGLALVYFHRGQLIEADAMMDRAILLRPRPSWSPSFRGTIDYWLKRKKPDKARAWVRKSFELDGRLWAVYDLPEWESRFPELEDTIAQLRELPPE